MSCPALVDPRIGKHLLTMAAEITGSVGVRQADIVKQDAKLSDGKSSNINPEGIRAVKRPHGGRDTRTSHDEPPNCHRGDNEHNQPSSVLLHIRPWQLDPNSEQANGQYHSHDFKCDHPALRCPTTRIKHVRAIRPHNHSGDRSDDDFADVQLRSVSTRWSARVQNSTNFLSDKRREHTELSGVRIPYFVTKDVLGGGREHTATTKPPRVM